MKNPCQKNGNFSDKTAFKKQLNYTNSQAY